MDAHPIDSPKKLFSELVHLINGFNLAIETPGWLSRLSVDGILLPTPWNIFGCLVPCQLEKKLSNYVCTVW